MNPLRELARQGQSVWLDYIRRNLLTSGELKRLIEEDGVAGVTSNPSIFEKAIAGSNDYDEGLRKLLAREAQEQSEELFEALAVEDIRGAADVLRPTFERSGGADGFVSIEVSPRLARECEGSIRAARRLWQEVNRPNLMIKIPGTAEGIGAIETLIAEGINVNVTLMFSVAHYEKVVRAYLRGLERCARPAEVASVASFFVSRVDTLVDARLEEIGTPEALALRGKTAIANSRRVYERFRKIFYGEAFAALRRKSARAQKVLWASTSTKNPAYSDVLYVEELVGPETINTIPPATLKAFREHGRVRGATLLEDADGAAAVLADLKKAGVDLETVAEKLQADGVAAFVASFDKLKETLEGKRRALLAGELDVETRSLPALEGAVRGRLEVWRAAEFCRRLWSRDPTLWATAPVPEITNRLGWLHLPEIMHEQLAGLLEFREQIKVKGFTHAVLLGMGGSSLAPEVFQKTFGNARGYPELTVLDSTHPAAVRAVESHVDLDRTLFVVSSKSGTTTETLSFFYYFWKQVSARAKAPGRQFIAITDPGTPLEKLGHERGFHKVFQATPDVGGRYSALTHFGLVPAALIGIDLHQLLDRAWTMEEACAFCVPESQNPGLDLGAVLGQAALAGRDKVTFLTSPTLAAFTSWLEQLIAESTGKDGKGIVPVAEEPVGEPSAYGTDRLFVHFRLGTELFGNLDRRIAALESAGHPVVSLRLAELTDIGQEFFRWEIAVAAAGAVIGIQPFNQPDVQLAKDLAQQAMKRPPAVDGGGPSQEAVSTAQKEHIRKAIAEWLSLARPGDYISVNAYLAPSSEITAALQGIRETLRERTRLATMLGYGPRFLHSTGQLHKGGPNTGLFLQLVDQPTQDLAVPETDYTFGQLICAQALGDYAALRQRGRRMLRMQLGGDVPGGLHRLAEVLRG